MNDGAHEASSAMDGAAGELVVARQGSLLVLQGPRDLVEQLTANEPALRDRAPSGPKRAGAIGSLAGLAAMLPTSGTYQEVFKLDSTALKQLKSGQLQRATDGSLSMMARGADGRFLKQGSLIPVDVNPTDLVNVQMALMTLALTSAINEVADAVARVEDKVDRLGDLLDAERVGAIVGAHRSLARRAELADPDGSLAEADWHAIDDVGIGVEQQIESLRSFVRKRLVSAEARGSDIADRRDALDDVGELSEALGLLVVAQDSLFLFQQLRLARIRDTEPARLPAAVDEARGLLADHGTEDADLLDRVRQVVAERATVKALEIHRFVTTGSLVARAGEVDQMLGWFAGQRTLAYEPIAEVEVPGINDAADELRTRGRAAVSGGRRIANGVIDRVRSRDDDRPGLPPGTEDYALPRPAEASGGVAKPDQVRGLSADGLRSRMTKVRRKGADRFRRRSQGEHQPSDEPEDETPMSESGSQ